MKRLAIVSIYDSDGKIYPYLEYYLYELKKVTQNMIIISNGMLQIEEKDKLKCFTDRIYERENVGYDAGAYKYIMQNYILENEWDIYDELILSNDTCFGPLQSFEEIFAQMNKKDGIDFWGINAIDLGLFKYIQSNFIVIKKQAFSSLRKHFNKFVNEYTEKLHDVCLQFETGLFVRLISDGFKAASYVEYNNLDPYKSSFYLVKDYKCPIIKKKTDIINYGENIYCIIKYIKRYTNYDSSLIENYYREKYKINLNYYEDNIAPQKIYLGFEVNEHDVERFIEENKKIYIYGIGNTTEYFLMYFKERITKLEGFIVSDGKDCVKKYCNHNVYKLSQVIDKSVGIIVALNSQNTAEVKRNLINYKNVLYLSK